jgi:hypothetical protein
MDNPFYKPEPWRFARNPLSYLSLPLPDALFNARPESRGAPDPMA